MEFQIEEKILLMTYVRPIYDCILKRISECGIFLTLNEKKMAFLLIVFLNSSCVVRPYVDIKLQPSNSSIKLRSSPYISSIISTNNSGSYGLGSVITIEIKFSENIIVSEGDLKLTLNTIPIRYARYLSGSGSNTLVFTYTVEAGDNLPGSEKLDYLSTSSLVFSNDLSVKSEDLIISANLTLPIAGGSASISATKSIYIDTTAPEIPSTLSLNSPLTSPGILSSPIIEVGGVAIGDTIRLFTDINCTTEVGSIVSSGTSVFIASSVLPNGSYLFFANARDLAGNISNCSSSSVAYNLVSIAQGVQNMTFNTSGVYQIPGAITGYRSNFVKKVLIDSNEKILLLGFLRNTATDYGDIFVHRLSSNGLLDTSFNSTGKIDFNFTDYETPSGIFVDSANRILIGGAYTTLDDPFFLRLNNNGSSDTTYGASGFSSYPLSGENTTRSMAVDPVNNSSYLVGDSGSGYGTDAFVVKFTSSGNIDNTFGTSGYYQFNDIYYTKFYGSAVDNNRKLVVVGSTKPGGAGDDTSAIILRFNLNGTMDTTFNGTGYLVLDNQLGVNQNEVASGLSIDSNNNIYLIGSAAESAVYDLMVWKISGANGQLVGGYGTSGAGYTRIGTTNGLTGAGGSNAKFDSMGNLVVVGSGRNALNNDLLVIRLLPTGLLDLTFATQGKFVLNGLLGYDGDDAGTSLDINSQGTIFVGGSSDKSAVSGDAILIRID
jgi:uncharacterized delta-60 repeat protein